MKLEPGTSVGPYEILGPVGAGGMGEVYRARDPRLGRDVAVKILPSAFAEEAERLRRFQQEARAAGALNHPNILAVHDVGSHDGAPYIVSELLAGETLRDRIGGSPLPLRKSLDYAVQIARGLAAAHEKGIVHRDLKPENLFVTRDGRVKILDFGLAKLGPEAAVAAGTPDVALSDLETATETLPGTLLGTLGYMSPEQAQGHPADVRSDIFAFGAVLYEMLTGQRAFRAPTASETLTAILKVDPLEARADDVALSPGLERILRHCLEKSPDERFQSAHDLAFALEALSGLSDGPAPRAGEGEPARWWRTAAWATAAAVLAAGLGVLAGWSWWRSEPTRLTKLTFRAGAISTARFSPDGRTIVYSAAWDGGPLELYTKRVGDRESRRHGLQGARVLSVSRSGELAVQLLPAGAPLAYYLWGDGTLARVPLAGGTPRELVKDVQSADWSPDGTQLAVSRWVEGKGVYRVEYPVGVVLYQSENRIIVVRVSPAGDRVAFLESISLAQTNTQQLHVVDRSGRDRVLTEGWGMAGIAWSPTGREIWNDIYDRDAQRAIRAVTLSGKVRPLLRFGGSEGSLSDVSVGGQALLVEGHGRHVIFGTPPGARGERNLSWNDDSSAVDLSRDGKTLLFTELLSGGGRSYGTSMRSMDGSPAVRLGDGYGVALSPDGRWALAFTAGGAALEFNLLPTGAGEARHLSEGLPAVFYGADWLPDSRSFVFSGSSSGGPARLYVQDIDGGAPRLLRDDDLTEPVISSDGSMLAAFDAYGQVMMAPLAGGDVRPVPGVEDGERPLEWRADGRTLYVYREDRLPVEVFEVDLATGTRRLVKEIALRGLSGVDPPHVVLALTPDAAGYAYSYRLALDELYLVTGLGR